MRKRVCFKICQILRGAIVPHLVHGSAGSVVNAAHLQWPEYNKTDPVWNDKSMGIIRAKSLYTYYFSIYSNPIKPLELYVHSAAFSLKRSPMGFYIWLHLYKIFSWVSFQIEPKILHFIIECPLLNTSYIIDSFPISLFDTEDWITQQFQPKFLKLCFSERFLISVTLSSQFSCTQVTVCISLTRPVSQTSLSSLCSFRGKHSQQSQ